MLESKTSFVDGFGNFISASKEKEFNNIFLHFLYSLISH